MLLLKRDFLKKQAIALRCGCGQMPQLSGSMSGVMVPPDASAANAATRGVGALFGCSIEPLPGRDHANLVAIFLQHVLLINCDHQ